MATMLKRGDVILVNLDGAVGSEMQNKRGSPRPCVVIQNDRGNMHSPLTIVAPMTLEGIPLRDYPHVAKVPAALQNSGGKNCAIDCGQVRAIDQNVRIVRVLGFLKPKGMLLVDAALRASLGLRPIISRSV